MTVYFPWPSYRTPWDFEIAEFELDGKLCDGAVDLAARRIRTDQFDSWTSLGCTVTAQTTESLPDGLEEFQPFVLVSAPSTQVRRAVLLVEKPPVDGVTNWVARLDLPRSQTAGVVTLGVQASAVYEGRRRAVGSSEPWALVVDASDAPRPPGAPPFETVWIDFASDAAPAEARHRPGAHALLDVYGTSPVLYLNASIDGFRHVLLADKAKLERRRHRDMLGASIARYALSTLFRSAADEVGRIDDSDEPEPPSTPLLREVCETVAASITGVGSVEGLYERLARSERDSAAVRSALWTEIDLAIDDLTQYSATIATICSEVKHA